jgi:hypothetical protein
MPLLSSISLSKMTGMATGDRGRSSSEPRKDSKSQSSSKDSTAKDSTESNGSSVNRSRSNSAPRRRKKKKEKMQNRCMNNLYDIQKKRQEDDDGYSGSRSRSNASLDNGPASPLNLRQLRAKSPRKQLKGSATPSWETSEFDSSGSESESDAAPQSRKEKKKKDKKIKKNSSKTKKKSSSSRDSQYSKQDEADALVSPLPQHKPARPKAGQKVKLRRYQVDDAEEDSSIDCSTAVPERLDHIQKRDKRPDSSLQVGGGQLQGILSDEDSDDSRIQHDAERYNSGDFDAASDAEKLELAQLIANLESDNAKMQDQLMETENTNNVMRQYQGTTSNSSYATPPSQQKESKYRRFMKPSLAQEHLSKHDTYRKTPEAFSKSMPPDMKTLLSGDSEMCDMLAQLQQVVQEIEKRAQTVELEAPVSLHEPQESKEPPRRPQLVRRESMRSQRSVGSAKSMMDLQAEVVALTSKPTDRPAPLKPSLKRQIEVRPDARALLTTRKNGMLHGVGHPYVGQDTQSSKSSRHAEPYQHAEMDLHEDKEYENSQYGQYARPSASSSMTGMQSVGRSGRPPMMRSQSTRSARCFQAPQHEAAGGGRPPLARSQSVRSCGDPDVGQDARSLKSSRLAEPYQHTEMDLHEDEEYENSQYGQYARPSASSSATGMQSVGRSGRPPMMRSQSTRSASGFQAPQQARWKSMTDVPGGELRFVSSSASVREMSAKAEPSGHTRATSYELGRHPVKSAMSVKSSSADTLEPSRGHSRPSRHPELEEEDGLNDARSGLPRGKSSFSGSYRDIEEEDLNDARSGLPRGNSSFSGSYRGAADADDDDQYYSGGTSLSSGCFDAEASEPEIVAFKRCDPPDMPASSGEAKSKEPNRSQLGGTAPPTYQRDSPSATSENARTLYTIDKSGGTVTRSERPDGGYEKDNSKTRQSSDPPDAATSLKKEPVISSNVVADEECVSRVHSNQKGDIGGRNVDGKEERRIATDLKDSDDVKESKSFSEEEPKVDNGNWLSNYIAHKTNNQRNGLGGRYVDPAGGEIMMAVAKSHVSGDPPENLEDSRVLAEIREEPSALRSFPTNIAFNPEDQDLISIAENVSGDPPENLEDSRVLAEIGEEPSLLRSFPANIAFNPEDQDLISIVNNPSCFNSKSNKEEDASIISELKPPQLIAFDLRANKEDDSVTLAKGFDPPTRKEEESLKPTESGLPASISLEKNAKMPRSFPHEEKRQGPKGGFDSGEVLKHRVEIVKKTTEQIPSPILEAQTIPTAANGVMSGQNKAIDAANGNGGSYSSFKSTEVQSVRIPNEKRHDESLVQEADLAYQHQGLQKDPTRRAAPSSKPVQGYAGFLTPEAGKNDGYDNFLGELPTVEISTAPTEAETLSLSEAGREEKLSMKRYYNGNNSSSLVSNHLPSQQQYASDSLGESEMEDTPVEVEEVVSRVNKSSALESRRRENASEGRNNPHHMVSQFRKPHSSPDSSSSESELEESPVVAPHAKKLSSSKKSMVKKISQGQKNSRNLVSQFRHSGPEIASDSSISDGESYGSVVKANERVPRRSPKPTRRRRSKESLVRKSDYSSDSSSIDVEMNGRFAHRRAAKKKKSLSPKLRRSKEKSLSPKPRKRTKSREKPERNLGESKQQATAGKQRYAPSQLQSAKLNERLNGLKERKRLIEGENKERKLTRNRSSDGLRKVRRDDRLAGMKKHGSAGTLIVESDEKPRSQKSEESRKPLMRRRKQSKERSRKDDKDDLVISIPAPEKKMSRSPDYSLFVDVGGDIGGKAARQSRSNKPKTSVSRKSKKGSSHRSHDYDLCVDVSYDSSERRSRRSGY